VLFLASFPTEAALGPPCLGPALLSLPPVSFWGAAPALHALLFRCYSTRVSSLVRFNGSFPPRRAVLRLQDELLRLQLRVVTRVCRRCEHLIWPPEPRPALV